MLAAGILMLVGVRRRQRLRAATPRSRVPEPRPEVVETELLLRRIEPGERGAADRRRLPVGGVPSHRHRRADRRRAGVARRRDRAHAVGRPLPARRRGPATATTCGICRPAFRSSCSASRRGGSGCRASRSPSSASTMTGSEVLVDLEACGTLAIDAQPSQADAVVRASRRRAGDVAVCGGRSPVTVSMSPDVLLDHRNAHQAESIDAAFDHAAIVGRVDVDERAVVVRTPLAAHRRRDVGTGGDPAHRSLTRSSRPMACRFPRPVTESRWWRPSGRTVCPDAPARLRRRADRMDPHGGGPVDLDDADRSRPGRRRCRAGDPPRRRATADLDGRRSSTSESPITDARRRSPATSEADDPESTHLRADRPRDRREAARRGRGLERRRGAGRSSNARRPSN